MRKVPDWCTYNMSIAEVVASRSKDPRTQVGCYVVDKNNKPLALGYNGFPSGVEETEELWTPENKHDYVIHAELNALLNAGCDLTGATMYVTVSPCYNCAKSVIAAGIKKVYYKERYRDFISVLLLLTQYKVEISQFISLEADPKVGYDLATRKYETRGE